MIIKNNMPNDFFEWLDKCPVQWFLIKQDDDSLEYSFTVPESENDMFHYPEEEE